MHQVLKELEGFLSKDLQYSRILSSMCTDPHPVAVKAHIMFIRSNLGDPGLFPGTAELERKLISELGELFGKKDVYGYVGSGGTEGNIQAIRAAKNTSKKAENIVVPESAHFSFATGSFFRFWVLGTLTSELKACVHSPQTLTRWVWPLFLRVQFFSEKRST